MDEGGGVCGCVSLQCVRFLSSLPLLVGPGCFERTDGKYALTKRESVDVHRFEPSLVMGWGGKVHAWFWRKWLVLV